MSDKSGTIRLSDGTELTLKVMIIDVKEVGGFSPFGGVNFSVSAMGGISTKSVPEDLKKLIADKQIAPSSLDQLNDGWELVDIKDQQPAIAEESVDSSKGRFVIRVVAEATMAARNLNYRVVVGNVSEPLYWVTWIYKITWKPEVRKDESSAKNV